MKKILVSILALALVFGLTGCKKEEEKKQELYVFNWGEYIDEVNISKFEKQYNCKVYYKTFDSNEEMYTAIVGGDKYDIVVPSDYMVERLIRENMIQKIDLSKITNFENLAEGVRHRDYDPNHEYSIPYFQGSFGIIYDTTKVELSELEEKGWSILIDPKYVDEVYMYNADRDNFLPAMKALGISLNTDSDEDIQRAYEWLVKQKQTIHPGYITDEINDLMANGEKTLAAGYSGAAVEIISNNEDMGFFEPLEGTNIWSDAMCIMKDCQNVELAHAWINFCLEPEVAKANSIFVGYTSSVQSVIDELTAEDGEFYGIDAYLPRVGYDKDEEYHDNNALKTKLGELWTKVMALEVQ